MIDLLSLCLYIIAFTAVYDAWNYFRSPLKNIPGPFLAKLTHLWRLVLVSGKQSSLTLRELHNRYGPVVRIGPNVLSLADPKWIRIVYATRGGFEKVRSAQQITSGLVLTVC
jgi:hypothetical protein